MQLHANCPALRHAIGVIISVWKPYCAGQHYILSLHKNERKWNHCLIIIYYTIPISCFLDFRQGNSLLIKISAEILRPNYLFPEWVNIRSSKKYYLVSGQQLFRMDHVNYLGASVVDANLNTVVLVSTITSIFERGVPKFYHLISLFSDTGYDQKLKSFLA